MGDMQSQHRNLAEMPLVFCRYHERDEAMHSQSKWACQGDFFDGLLMDVHLIRDFFTQDGTSAKSRWCELQRVGSNSQFSGNSALWAAITFCEAAGYQRQSLQDSSFFGSITDGILLGMFHRGWTWYMR